MSRREDTEEGRLSESTNEEKHEINIIASVHDKRGRRDMVW